MRKMGIRWMRPHGHQIMKVMVATKMVAMQQLHAKNKTVIKIEPGISPRFLDHGASSYRRASQHDGEGDAHLRDDDDHDDDHDDGHDDDHDHDEQLLPLCTRQAVTQLASPLP